MGARRHGRVSAPKAMSAREARIARKTRETDIDLRINLDGKGESKIETGIGFLNHMLEQLARHGLMDIEMSVKGDLHVDQHHTTEDSALALGEAIKKALGDKVGIRRYGSALIPMDETLARVAIDLSDRPYLIWKVRFSVRQLGGMDTELFREWFHALSQAAGMTLHVEILSGRNTHHMIESCYKALARALREAIEPDPRAKGLPPSTKTLSEAS